MSLQFDRSRHLQSWEISYTELSLSERIAAVVDRRIVAAAWAHLALVSQPWHCHPGLATAELRSFGVTDPTPPSSLCSIPCPQRESWREGHCSNSIGTCRTIAVELRRQPLGQLCPHRHGLSIYLHPKCQERCWGSNIFQLVQIYQGREERLHWSGNSMRRKCCKLFQRVLEATKSHRLTWRRSWWIRGAWLSHWSSKQHSSLSLSLDSPSHSHNAHTSPVNIIHYQLYLLVWRDMKVIFL